MTLPKQYLPGSIYLVTRRCTQRQFLLRPSALTNQIFAYCLARAMEQTHVEVYAFCVLSNHYHLVVRDPYARLPEFMEYLNKFVSKCINASLDRVENVWASEPPSSVVLATDEDVLDKMVYTLVNPVAAGLVNKGRLWPGLRSTGANWLGAPELASRPTVFFRKGGKMPDQVELKLTRPPIFAGMSDEEVAAELEQRVLAREGEERKLRKQKGKKFLGRSKVLSQSPYDRPRRYERRRTLSPRVACHDKWRRVEAIRRLKQFWIDYRDALQHWMAGIRDVVFPAGTYALRVRAGVNCSPP